MKRIYCLVLTVVFVVVSLLPLNVYATPSYEAKKSTVSIQVDEVPQTFEAYTVNDNNYFKLRDIAFILNNTEKNFSVEWQKQNNAVVLKTGHPYSPIGTEMGVSSIQTSQTAIPTTSKMFLDGEKIEVTAYLINGNNYLKLRDLGEALNFGVDWNDVTSTIQISSNKGYNQEIGDSPIQPWKYQKMLGKGLDVDWSGNRRGKQYYNVQAVKDFKAAGISHVRIRMIDDATEELLSGLDQQIKDCLENGLIPVIAYHGGDFETNPSKETMKKAINWWKIVANRYKDYSNLLSFDLIIEVSDALNKESEILNEFYEQAVAEIRKSNPTRIIMISPRLRSDASYLNDLKIPTMHNNYLMAEWHFYASGPSKTTERKIWTTGTDAEKKLVLDKINIALNWQKQTGIPTWVGAWMPGNYNEGNTYTIDEQVVFSSFITQSLTQANIPFAVNSDTKFYNRETNQWILEKQPVFQSIFGSSNIQLDNVNTKIQENIRAGFNAKATLSSTEQCALVKKELQKLKENGVHTDKIWLRLNGGTISQKTLPDDWSNNMIQEWANLQQEFGCPYVFVVNFNDSPKNQWSFYQKLKNSGINFSFVELGNEQYLPKFAEKYTGKDDEISKRTAEMTAEKYIELSNEYISAFDSENLPFGIQFAPEHEERHDYSQWNMAIAKAINEEDFNSSNIYGTIHLYERDGSETLDVTQINRIRNLVKRPISMAVTEFGVADKLKKLPYEQFVAQEKLLTQRIIGQLGNGDMLFSQVLYTDYKKITLEIFHSAFDGITPKGKMIMSLFQKYWQ